jgi:hypothetical protein
MRIQDLCLGRYLQLPDEQYRCAYVEGVQCLCSVWEIYAIVRLRTPPYILQHRYSVTMSLIFTHSGRYDELPVPAQSASHSSPQHNPQAANLVNCTRHL